MKISASILLFFSFIFLHAQENQLIDDKYYEDQFYVGVQYNALLNTKNDIENIGVPYSFEAGFIKDFPLNKQRNMGFGLGIGYSYDILRPNITINDDDDIELNINSNIGSSRYLSHNLEIPLEFRWRTSTAQVYNFWRIYTGVSYIYSFSNKTELSSGGNTTTFTDIDIFNKTNYTLYTSVGYGTWNLHLKYYIRSPFKDSIRTTDNKPLNFNQLKIGIMFYIL
ncbi:outer membrane beta-barrel protein [Wenyingzhuangia sp. IMCC45533]